MNQNQFGDTRQTELTLNRGEGNRLKLMTIFFGGRKENPFMPNAANAFGKFTNTEKTRKANENRNKKTEKSETCVQSRQL